MKNKKVLVVAAHPDDEVLGAGATIARHTSEGDEVRVLILGEGVTSRADISVSEKKKALEQLKKSAIVANKILGVKHVTLAGLPDQQFDTVPLLSINHAIEKVLREYSPELIYTHSPTDLNLDHRKTVESSMTAARPTKSSSVLETRVFEVPSSTEWNFILPEVFRPNLFVRVSEKEFGKKMKALSAYGVEMRTFPPPRSTEYIRALATVRGGQSGLSLAEAFCVLYQIGR